MDSGIVLTESEALPENGEVLGTVKWFSRMKGWGFIEPDGGECFPGRSRKRDSISTFTGNAETRRENELKCCWARTVVGTSIAT